MRRRGHIAERGKGKWLIKFSADGKQRYAWCHGSRRDAEDKLAQLLAAASTGTLADPSQVTVAAYVRETLDAAHDLAATTRQRYGELLQQQIGPHIGEVRLQKLTPGHIEKVARRLARSRVVATHCDPRTQIAGKGPSSGSEAQHPHPQRGVAGKPASGRTARGRGSSARAGFSRP